MKQSIFIGLFCSALFCAAWIPAGLNKNVRDCGCLLPCDEVAGEPGVPIDVAEAADPAMSANGVMPPGAYPTSSQWIPFVGELLQPVTAAGRGRPGDHKAAPEKIIPGAESTALYLSRLKGKRVGVFANHTSVLGGENIVDALKKKGVKISVIFGPEHGFRGTADAGEKVGNYTDAATGIPVVSLYGSKHRPSKEDLKNVDVLLFDIQDVGTRFYTYISSLQELMEAAIENKKPLIVLDRPNPNGFYVDGPVLDTAFRSFVGMQPVPIVYGMTVGEYAYMLAGEQWLRSKLKAPIDIPASPERAAMSTRRAPVRGQAFSLTIIPCAGYTHKSKYILPVKPSPNLPDIQSVYWYPSTCFFEGTALSEGRGTARPFQLFGHPSLPQHLASFTPRSMPGATKPKLMDQLCYGWDLSGTPAQVLQQVNSQVQIKYLLEAYKLFPQKDSFFLNKGNFFNKLAGNDVLLQQIKAGKSEAEIRQSWEPALSRFKAIRKKYLIYEDF